VSPFLSVPTIEQLAEKRSETTLVSTGHELARLPRPPAGIQRFYVLNERAQAEPDSADEAAPPSAAEAIQLRDLHAKLYVTEVGRNARIWTGSANATASGFDRNVEFLVELVGPKRQFGLDSLLVAERDSVRFINLLTPASDAVATEVINPDAEALERKIDDLRSQLAGAKLEARVDAAGDLFDMSIWCPTDRDLRVDDGLEVRCWPSTVAPQSAAAVLAGPGDHILAAFKSLTQQALTSFFVFEIAGRVGACEQKAGFVLNLPLVGAPEGRREAVLRSLLQDRHRLLRFLMLLLANEGAAVPDFDDEGESGKGSSRGRFGGFSPNGLFEMLLRALDEAPHRLDHLESLLTQLRQGRDEVALLPDGFDAIWKPILAHRRTLREKA
jgi:hypothetical protein